ncbi:unnamed protein product [Penicillium bialowiezense]
MVQETRTEQSHGLMVVDVTCEGTNADLPRLLTLGILTTLNIQGLSLDLDPAMGTRLGSQCGLELINLDEENQFNELHRQRVICGWDSDPNILLRWKDRQASKRLFWIIYSDVDSQHSVHTGHISLDASSKLLEPEALKDGEIELSINSFFILPDYRQLGLGKRAVHLVEQAALSEPYGDPRCRFITLTALSKRYIYDMAPEWGESGRSSGCRSPRLALKSGMRIKDM